MQLPALKAVAVLAILALMALALHASEPDLSAAQKPRNFLPRGVI